MVNTLKERAISIVIPTFNSAGCLEQSLKSIRNQKFAPLEVIIVDGGSKDNTLLIARSQPDLVRHIIAEPDHGIYDAINKGVSRAAGALICVLGSDDELEVGALGQVHAEWKANATDIIAGRASLQDADGNRSLRADETFGLGALLTGIPFCHNAMFVTPEAYARVGPYNLDYRICADAEWVHRAISIGCTCQQIDTVVVRFNHGGLSTTSPDAILVESFRVVANNFPGLSVDDAEALFRAVRGWSDISQVQPILLRHRGNPNLLLAAAVAFSERCQRLSRDGGKVPTAPTRMPTAWPSMASRLLRRLGLGVGR